MKREARCGTPSGWAKHKRAGEKPCDACARSKSEYDARLRSAPDKVRRNRLASRAQARAYKALAHNHPSEYRALYAAYKAELERESGDE